MPGTILNVRELAAFLKVTPGTIRKWQRRGIIPALKRLSQRPILFDWDVVKKALGWDGEAKEESRPG